MDHRIDVRRILPDLDGECQGGDSVDGNRLMDGQDVRIIRRYRRADLRQISEYIPHLDDDRDGLPLRTIVKREDVFFLLIERTAGNIHAFGCFCHR